jgi:hypothetical protein
VGDGLEAGSDENGGDCRATVLPSLPRSILVVDRFAPEGRTLRAHLDERFAEPRASRPDRFVWDYWHVPGQYTALRTPAWTYFPRAPYEAFHRRLVLWGRRVLGCHDVSPPWLSCYVEGCGQELHGDLPHGPWAFVYSLTRWRGRPFRGGETLILRDTVLDHWTDFRSTRRLEKPDLFRSVEPLFGRLTVFDPRIPHAVATVRGTLAPERGRLVIHGWFVQPRPFVEGPLAPRELAARIDELSSKIRGQLAAPLAGLLSIGLRVTPGGAVEGVRVLSDTTRAPSGAEAKRRRFVAGVRAAVARWRFSKRGRGSRITLPLVFERGGS